MLSDATYPSASLVESILAERCLSTWQDSEINQIQTLNWGNHNDWPKEAREKCPIEVTEITTRAQLSLSLSLLVCLSTHTVLFFPPNKHCTYFTTFCLCGNTFSAKLKGQGLVTTLV